ACKIPGRAGDSPILGAGLHVDTEVGAAGSTGRGQPNLYNLSSILIVEQMRRGASPKFAALTALKRGAKNTIEQRPLTDKGQENAVTAPDDSICPRLLECHLPCDRQDVDARIIAHDRDWFVDDVFRTQLSRDSVGKLG